jgi:hypothetical protein
MCNSFYCYYYFIGSTGLWTRASHLLGNCSVALAMHPCCFALVLFDLERVSLSFCLGPAVGLHPPIFTSCTAEITGAYDHTSPIICFNYIKCVVQFGANVCANDTHGEEVGKLMFLESRSLCFFGTQTISFSFPFIQSCEEFGIYLSIQ